MIHEGRIIAFENTSEEAVAEANFRILNEKGGARFDGLAAYIDSQVKGLIDYDKAALISTAIRKYGRRADGNWDTILKNISDESIKRDINGILRLCSNYVTPHGPYSSLAQAVREYVGGGILYKHEEIK